MNQLNDNQQTESPIVDTSFVKPVDVGNGKSMLNKINISALSSYLIIIICALVSIASLIYLVIPQFQKLSEINSQKEQVETQFNQVKSRADYLDGLNNLQDELDQNIELSKQAIPTSEDEIPYILDQMIQIASESGVEISSLGLGGVSSATAEGP